MSGQSRIRRVGPGADLVSIPGSLILDPWIGIEATLTYCYLAAVGDPPDLEEWLVTQLRAPRPSEGDTWWPLRQLAHHGWADVVWSGDGDFPEPIEFDLRVEVRL